MKLNHFLVTVVAGAFLAMNASAQLVLNVSADPGNNTGVFSGFDPQNLWTSGDIALPADTAIGFIPFEITLNLSHDLTLNDSGHYSWFLNYDDSSPIAENSDLGSLFFVLLENGSPVSPETGFDDGPNSFGRPITQFGTGNSDLPPNLTFNEVQIFVSNDTLETLDDVQLTLDVPEPNTLALLALGLVTLLGLGYRKASAFRNQP